MTDRERHAIHLQAERSYQRGQYPASVHDIYILAYIDAVTAERQRQDRRLRGE